MVRKVYSGAVDERGRHLYPGGQAYGSELAWSPWFIPPDSSAPQESSIAWSIGNGWVKYLAFDPNPPLSYDVNGVDFSRREFRRADRLAGLYDATDPDLSAFRRSGGKLILWHGWADQAIPPTGTVAYYQAMQDRMGGLAATQRFARLFMFPGMFHCSGGDAPNSFDLLTPLMEWVESGEAPERVVAAQRSEEGDVVRTRPVFAHPKVARYDGERQHRRRVELHRGVTRDARGRPLPVARLVPARPAAVVRRGARAAVSQAARPRPRSRQGIECGLPVHSRRAGSAPRPTGTGMPTPAHARWERDGHAKDPRTSPAARTAHRRLRRRGAGLVVGERDDAA